MRRPHSRAGESISKPTSVGSQSERGQVMIERESCYGCDYFYPPAELYAGQVEGYAVKLCPECKEKGE